MPERGASAQQSCESTYSLIGREDEDVTRLYHQRGKNKKEKSRQTTENVYTDNQHQLQNDSQEKMGVMDKPEDDKDYEDVDEEERENVYHVLEGPTPEGGVEEETEENCVQRENEASTYEIPVALVKKE